MPRLDDPSTIDPQPGISLERDSEVSAHEAKSLPLSLGEAPAPGQYVVHDTDDLVLPYLPDPMAQQIGAVFFSGPKQLEQPAPAAA